MSFLQKIKSQREIVAISKRLKKQGKRIATFNGSFDVLHLGHISSLQEAKDQADVLIILLNSDKSVKSYKGPNRPIVPENERAKTLAALECVDYVSLFDDINPKIILSKIKPNVHCNGSEWGKDCVERGVVESSGGKIYILKQVEGLSTSNLMRRISNVGSLTDAKAIFLDRDGTVNINEPEYVHKISDFKFVPGAIKALQKLSKTDYKIIIATNQSGIARGYFKEKDLKILHQWMNKELKKKKIRIDKIYYCPHGPKDNCLCRKPEIGMLQKAVADFGISLSKSWIIGDDEKDIIMGREANLKTIKIGPKMTASLKLEPNFYAKNLLEAADIIISK